MILRITRAGIIRNKAGEVSELILPVVITSDVTGTTATCTTRDDLAAFLHRHNCKARCFLTGEIEQLLADYMPTMGRQPRVRTQRRRNIHYEWMIFAG
ncbi:MAG: hypothetical protein ACK4VZ_10615 [Paracoccaceae bacterium]